MGHQVLEPGSGPANTPPGGAFARAAPMPCTAATPPATLSASGIGERSGVAGQRLRRPDRDERPRPVRGGDLRRLECDQRVAAVPSAARKRWWRCSIAGCGWSVTIASLSSSGDRRVMTFGETRTSESPTLISPRQTSGSRSPVGQAALAVRIGQRRETSLADQVGLGRADRRDIQLVVADDGDRDPDRAVVAGPVQRRARSRWWLSRLFAERDRLLDADPDPGRLVVVVLAAHRLGGELGRLLRLGRRDRRGHDQVEVALAIGRSRRSSARRSRPCRGSRTRGPARRSPRASSADGRPSQVSRGGRVPGIGGRRGSARRVRWTSGRTPRMAGRSAQYTRRSAIPHPSNE